MAVVWQNTFDGTPGTNLTVANSANHGDAIAGLRNNPPADAVRYGDQAVLGASSMRLGTDDASAHGDVWLYFPAINEYSISFYLLLPQDTWFRIRDANVLTEVYFATESEQYLLGTHTVPSSVMANVIGTWVRVEISATTEQLAYRLYWSDIHGDGTPDYEYSEARAGGTIGNIFTQGSGTAVAPTPYLDEPRIGEGEWLGPRVTHLATSAAATITATGQADTSAVEGPTAIAADTATVTGQATATKSVTVPATTTLTALGAAQVSKHGITGAEGAAVVHGVALLEEFRVPVDWPPAITAEMRVDGQWVDITSDVYVREDIQITRGRQDEASAADPGKMSLLLNNRHGRYSPRNPLSPYYGRIGRNTPLRVRVAALPVPRQPRLVDTFDRTVTDGWGTADTGQDWTATAGSAANLDVGGHLGRITVDATDTLYGAEITDEAIPAAIDLTCTVQVSDYVVGGDLREGIEFQVRMLHEGGGGGGYAWSVSFRTDTGSARGLGRVIAALVGEEGYFGPLIIAEGVTYTPGVPMRVRAQAVDGRQLRLRVWPDGAEEPDVWHAQAYAPVPVAGGGLTLAAGATSNVALPSPLEVGIGDLVVREYTPTNHAIRMVGEVSAWPPRWDTSGNDVTVPVEASGVLRRLGQGATPLRSALRRALSAGQPVAYWPLEDGVDTRLATSAVDQVDPLTVSGLEFGKNTDLVPSESLPTVGGSGAHLYSGTITSRTSDAWSVDLMYRLAEDDAPEDGEEPTLLEWATGGTVARWRVTVRRASGVLSVRVYAYDDDGDELISHGASGIDTVTPPFTNQWNHLRVGASQNGGDIAWRLDWIDAEGTNLGVGDTLSGATMGGVTSIDTRIGAELKGLGLGHITVWGGRIPTAYNEALTDLAGEHAGQRAGRLAAGAPVPLLLEGAGATPLGQEGVATLLDLLDESGEADLGVLGEQRGALGLRYRGRDTLYDQVPVLVLDYSAGEITPPLEPTDDDQGTRNDVVAKRERGGEYRATDEAGPMGIATVGRYDESVTVNVATDSQLPDQAGWRLHLGTIDEARYPVVTLNLANSRMRPLLEQVIAITEGDRIRIDNLPNWLPPGPADLIVQGYTETLNVYTWTVELVCTPASPWTVAHVPPRQTVTEGFEDEDYAVTITDGGDEPWRRTAATAANGLWSLRSGAIAHGQTSDAIVTVPAGATELAFWYRVSSEEDFDYLRVLVDGSTELEVSGEVPWVPTTLDVTGASTVTFRYAKDGSETVGEDRAWIDDLVFTLADEVSVPDEPDRADTAGSALGEAIGETTTSFDVVTTAGPTWVDSSGHPEEFPFDITCGGEVMRVTSISGSSSPQTFTVTRAINGIVKSHSAGADVRLAQSAITAL